MMAQMEAMATMTIHEAKTNLSKLVKRAATGETVYIGSYGRPEAALTGVNMGKYRAELRKGFFGCMKGQIVSANGYADGYADGCADGCADGWDEPLSDDIIDSFYSMQGLQDFAKK